MNEETSDVSSRPDRSPHPIEGASGTAARQRPPDRHGGEIAPGLLLDDFLPYLLNRIVNRLNLDLAEDLQGEAMTLQQYRVLAVLMAGDGRNVGELSVYTVIAQSTLSKLLERMARIGLVERRQGDRDGRVVTIHITDKGRAGFSRILPVALHHFDTAFAGIEEDERRRFAAILHKVLDNVRKSQLP